ncbi:MAG: helix-turn-helix domain-containing protein [Legionellaceae bacterium]
MTRKKIAFLENFASRLHEAMRTAGHASGRSTSGIDIHQLVEITGYSAQMCRKYLRGEAMPEPIKLHEIAQRLGVSPGWLLFGHATETTEKFPQTYIHINQHCLRTLFEKAETLYEQQKNTTQRTDFLMNLVHNISQTNLSEAQSHQMIDLALTSATHFIQDAPTEMT